MNKYFCYILPVHLSDTPPRCRKQDLYHPTGVLLLHFAVHIFGSNRRVCQICDHGNRRHHGRHDPRVLATHGQNRAPNPAPLRPWGNVHLLYFHHHFIPYKGVSYKIVVSKLWELGKYKVRIY